MNKMLLLLVALLLTSIKLQAQTVYTPYTFATLAGVAQNAGSNDGVGDAARFRCPYGVAVDTSENIFVVDSYNHTIRKVTPAGVVTTVAGQAYVGGTNDGTSTNARFRYPDGIAADPAGNLFVADTENHTIRKLTPSGTNWVVTTIAGQPGDPGTNDGLGNTAQFDYPFFVAADSNGNLYVSDSWNYAIRKLTPAGTNWMVSTLAGIARPGGWGTNDGQGTNAQFYEPAGLVVDGAGNLYVADGGDTIRKVTPDGGVTTVAGSPLNPGSVDGMGGNARFEGPTGIAMDSAGNLYVTDSDTIRKMTPEGTNWVVTTMAGLTGSYGSNDGTGSNALFLIPAGIAVDSVGDVYVAEYENHTIRRGFIANGTPQIFPPGPGFGFQGGQFGFDIAGPAGGLAAVETSTDLTNWQAIWTNTIGTGALHFSDADGGSYTNRFYRARIP